MSFEGKVDGEGRLPIDPLLDKIASLSELHASLVIEAPPGAGKTTRVPVALARANIWPGAIWVAEPRRLAAKLVAQRVATETKSRLGDAVGYTVRFDDCSGPSTRIRFVTSGILLRRLITDPLLAGVGCVILDEFHERHLETDLALALTIRAQQQRPDLRVIVMSATLEAERISELMGNCPSIRAEGRAFPLEIQFQTGTDERPLEKRVASALRSVFSDRPATNALVFLPGAAEIRRVEQAIAPFCEQSDIDVTILHGDLGLEAQTKAVSIGTRPRVVLSTNIAESSITVDGITAVIDSGLCRQKEHSAFSGLSRLTIQKISQASATQRAGRAGRTAPGRAIRLYTRGDFESRSEFDTPEILRTDFTEAWLMLMAATTANLSKRGSPRTVDAVAVEKPHRPAHDLLNELALLDRPSHAAVDAAHSLLCQLGAVQETGRLTELGRRLARMPLHPRLARLLVECETRDIASLGALVVALLSERELRSNNRTDFAGSRDARRNVISGNSDILEVAELYLEARRHSSSPHTLRQLGIEPGAFHAVRRTHDQFERLVGCQGQVFDVDEAAEQSLAKAILLAFPDRVAKRRTPEGRELILRAGTKVSLSDASVVAKSTWMVAVDVEQRQNSDRNGMAVVRLASAIDPDWLLDLMTDEITDQTELLWCDPPGRVEALSRMRLGSLTIEESRRPAKPSSETTGVLMEVVKNNRWLQSEELESLFIRLALISEELPSRDKLEDSAEIREQTLRAALDGRTDLVGMNSATLGQIFLARLPQQLTTLLRTQTPESISLPGGRHCQVHYEPGRPPWIASRLQDFFGLTESPTILCGRKKLVLQLLAPNQRAVQITDDLGLFWVKHYPAIRSELMRRYPRHAWPQDGRTASPPEVRPGRRH